MVFINYCLYCPVKYVNSGVFKNIRAFEVLTVFASRLGAVAVSAQSIMLQLVVLAFMLPLGISVAASSMVLIFFCLCVH